MSKVLFDLDSPATDLEATKKFYVDGLGCTLWRESESAGILGLAGLQCHKRLYLEIHSPELGELDDAAEARKRKGKAGLIYSPNVA